MTDPAAIDLAVWADRLANAPMATVLVDKGEVQCVIAEVEALRERVAGQENMATAARQVHMEMLHAAEVHAAELAGALEACRVLNHTHDERKHCALCIRIKASLAATRTDALERAKAKDEALKFYADPKTYLAIGFFPDPPCGDFMDDFEDLDEELGHPDGGIWTKPGKRARAALAQQELTP